MTKVTLFQRETLKKNKSGNLLCFWAVREPGLSLMDMAKHLGISVSDVGYAVETGEAIARDNNYHLI